MNNKYHFKENEITYVPEGKGRKFIVTGFNQFGDKVTEEVFIPDSGEIVTTKNKFTSSMEKEA